MRSPKRSPKKSGTGRAKLVAVLATLGATAPAAWAKNKADADADDDVKVVDGDGDAKPAPAKKKKSSDAESPKAELQKQDLSGHDLGTAKKENAFEHDRFFIDKTDTEKTEKATLIQGSLASTTFAYFESGGTIPPPTLTPPAVSTSAVPSASPLSRLFTELRLQTDFRHISAGRWDARIDVRGRLVNNPDPVSGNGYVPSTDSRIQSGFLGKQELELKELWLVRNGVRSDVFIGRQFIPDLGGVKIDGLRVDYASSTKFTLLGFGGLYPIRGSRSITSDYTPLLSNPDNNGNRSSAGRFTGAAGFGAAYRTLDAYGSFGGVALVPLSSESPRVYGTATGYWRYSPKLDLYHFAILDVVGSNAVNTGLTNLSIGANYKPDQRLRATLSFNRVDTETLNVQAQAFLSDPDKGFMAVQNEAYLQRIATNEGRASLSAGLGPLQRFEATAALTYRRRDDLSLSPPPQAQPPPPALPVPPISLPAAQSIELYGALTDRRSFKDLRLGVDGSRSFGIGSVSYQRTTALALRASASHEFGNGHGEWEAELAYSSTKDDSAGVACVSGVVTDLSKCFGAAKSSIVSIGGTLFYRINRDWFALGSLFLNRTAITHVDVASSPADPAVIGLSGYFRIAYRF